MVSVRNRVESRQQTQSQLLAVFRSNSKTEFSLTAYKAVRDVIPEVSRARLSLGLLLTDVSNISR